MPWSAAFLTQRRLGFRALPQRLSFGQLRATAKLGVALAYGVLGLCAFCEQLLVGAQGRWLSLLLALAGVVMGVGFLATQVAYRIQISRRSLEPG